MNDLPTPAEELARKAIGALSDLVHASNEGRITDNELHTAVNAIYDTVSGLIDRETLDVIYAARGATPRPFVERFVFVKAGKTVILERPLGKAEILVVLEGATETVDYGNAPNCFAQVMAKLAELRGKLAHAGWRELA